MDPVPEHFLLSETGFSISGFGKFSRVRSTVTGGWLSGENEILPGCYQVDFHLCDVQILPIGKIQVFPLDTVAQVQAYLGERIYSGKVLPMITVGGSSLHPTR